MRAVIAGGGTGGHLYPGITLAREILRRDPEGAILFVGTEGGLETRILPKEGFDLETIPVSGLKGKRKGEQLRAFLQLPFALLRSLSILRSFRPDVVVGVGGYASGPLAFGGFLSGRRIVLQEQNSVPGLTNRLLGWIADRVYTAYDEAAESFPKRKVRKLGNPIRSLQWEGDSGSARTFFGLDPELPLVLVIGGSRGAHAVNTAVMEMVRKMKGNDPEIQFLHQTGDADAEAAGQAYREAGVRAVVKAYLYEMAPAYQAADLAISRAGAIALSELCAAGLPAVLIPFPYAADDHQFKNARVLEEAGAARLIAEEELAPERLSAEVRELLGNREVLARMSNAARQCARPAAAKDLVDDLERMMAEER
ncbi:MAG: undecaprenyldiphospho-muramoylpentapeptide beta-N-acetylglucosaminyltransferase [Deltaproteobacteria bacterium]|nr:undecaprenyldiphospho-muramoylpentapeptide beta-N-acetylglucosaminyltransferase [Deltaproteobacteria bacterium]